MAVTKTETKYSVKVIYKVDYDTAGDFYNLKDYTQTFTNVKETATLQQLKDFVDALMSFTAYAGAPYVVKLVDTGELVVE